MTEIGNGNRRRSASPAIDGVDELWSRLRDATKEAKALATTNRQLAARVQSLERQLFDTGGLSDDELVAELPRRMSRALESAQEVAEELVGRAKKREEVIRQKTDQRANALIAHAEAEATAIVRRAAEEAVGRVNEAKAQAMSIMRTAHSRHDQVMAELQEQSGQLQERIRQLRHDHSRLVRAYEVIDRTLGEARAALQSAGEMAGDPLVADGERRTATQNGSTPTGQLYAVKADGVAVYDWSPPALGTA